ncbi:MAG: hypothetical protein ACXWP6_10000 [Ktedonobacterales bacterium]
MTYGLHELHEHPSESMNWRRHRSGCPNYRERWFPQSDTDAGEPMYQVFCLLNTPPETFEEQENAWRAVVNVGDSRRRSIPRGGLLVAISLSPA